MPNGNTYTTEEFAIKIRDKYNAYSDISDEELVAKIVKKYPIYGDQISDEVVEEEVVEETTFDPFKPVGLSEEEYASTKEFIKEIPSVKKDEVKVEDVVKDVVEEEGEKDVITEEEVQTFPKIQRVEEIKEELKELESSFSYDPTWAPEAWVKDEKLDEYYKDEPRYQSWKKRKELIDASVLTDDEIQELKTKQEDLDYWSPQLPSEVLDSNKVYSDAELESIAIANADYSKENFDVSKGAYFDPVLEYKNQLIYQQSLNGGNGREAQIRTQQVEEENKASGVSEKMRVTGNREVINALTGKNTMAEAKAIVNEQYGVSPFGLTNIDIEGEVGSGVYIPGEMELETISTNPDVVQTYESGVKLIKGPLPLHSRGDVTKELLTPGWMWDHIAHGLADNSLGTMLSFGLTDQRFHYELPSGEKVPYEYFNSPEAQNAYTKRQAEKSQIDELVKFDGDKAKQVDYVEDKVNSFLTQNELTYRDKEEELIELTKNAKTDEEKLAVSQLKSEIDKEREELGLGERLYDTDGNLMNSIATFKSGQIEEQAEEVASTTGLDQLRNSLVSDYYEYMTLLKEVGKHTIDIGKSRSAPEKIIGKLMDVPSSFKKAKGQDTFYDDVEAIQKMIETGELGSIVDLPGNHPLASRFEEIQNRMLVKNRAIQLNSDPTTQSEINEFARQIGNLIENVTGENPIQQAYNSGFSVGTTDQEERYSIMKDIKEELGYVLPQELIDNHEHEWYEYAGDVTTSLIPLVTTSLLLKNAGYTKPQVFNKLGDVLKGNGKSRAWNGVVNTLIGSTKYQQSALNEIAYFAGVDKAMELGFNSDPASQTFIGSLGAGNAIYSQISNKLLGKYGQIISPLINTISKTHVGKGVVKTLGPALSSTIVFEGAKGVEHFSTHGVDGIEEIFSVPEVIGDFLGFAAMSAPGSIPPGIENLSRDILALRGYTVESFKASKTLGLKTGKDGYFPSSKEINDKVLEKTNELIDAAGGEGGRIDAPKLEQLQKDIYEIEQAGEALNQHNDIVKAKKTANYITGLDASAYVVSQKLLKGEELTAKDQAVLNQLGPEYIAYKINGNKPAGVEMQGAVDRVYKNNQNTYNVLAAYGINPMSKEGIELVTSITESSKLSSRIEKLQKQIKKQPANRALLEKQLEQVNKQYEQIQAEQKGIIERSQEKSDKSYEEDLQDTRDLVEEINKKGGFFGEEISVEPLSDDKWIELKLDTEAEGQFRDNTLYIHESRAKSRKANSVASHELLHALLKNSFKNKNGDITKEGMEVIDNFRDLLPPDQQKLINDRIIEEYGVDKDGKATVSKEKYYEEYLNAFIDGIKQDKIQYSDKTWDKLAEQVGPNFRNVFGKGKVGVTSGKELFNFLRDFNKANTSPKARARIVEFATKDNVPGVKKQPKTTVEQKPVASKSRKLKKELVAENTELFANKPEGWKKKLEENTEKIKGLSVPTDPKGLNKLDWRQYKNNKEWRESVEYELASEYLYNSFKDPVGFLKRGIDKKVKIEDPIAKEDTFIAVMDELAKFKPELYPKTGNASLKGYINTFLNFRGGTIASKAWEKKKKTRSIDEAVGGKSEGKTQTRGSKLVDKDKVDFGEEVVETVAPKSTMRQTESIKLSDKEVEIVEKDIDKWIDSNIEGLLKKDSKTLTTKLKAQSKKAIKDIILTKLPLARNKVAYETALKDLYKEFEKLADISLSEGGKRVKGDPSIFITKGGKGFKDFIYSEKGFTEGGNPKRVVVRKGKENIAWQFRKFGNKPGEISEKDFIDFFTRKGEYKDAPSRPNELRTKIADIIAETVFKDAMPEALKRNKEKLGPEAQREILFEEISNDLMRDSDLILSKSPDLAKSLENIKEAEKANIEKRRILDELAYLRKNNPKAEASLLQTLQKGDTIGDWLKENPKFNSYFAGSIMSQLKAIAKAAKEQGGASVKKGIDAMPDKVVIDGKTIDISGLKDYMKSPESAMYGQTKKGGQKANWFDEVILERYVNHAVKFAEKLPTWIQEMANKEAVLQTVGLGTSPTAKSALSVEKSIERINKQQDKLKAENKDLRIEKPKGWESKIEINNKKIEALRQKEPTPKIGLQTGREMHNIPWVRNQGDRVMKALGKNESKAFEGLKERLKDFYTDSQMKAQMGKEFKDLTDVEIAEFVSEKINEGNNALRREVYNAIQKAKEEYIAEAKTEAEKLERMEYVLRKAKENTNLTSGLDRQAVAIESIYWPKGKKLNLETLKLEHLKTSVDQSMQSASAIIQGKWDTLGKKSTEDYVGVLSPKRLLDIIDREGGTTNTSTLARMALDIEELKNYRTVESGFKETYYDAIVNRVAKDLKLSSVEIKALKEPYLTDALNLYRGNTNEIGKIIVDNALKNKNELKKVAENNRDIQPIASKSKELKPISMSVERLAKIDKVLNEARKFDKKVKKARVFDFDDTVARTKSNVLYEMPNGKKGKLTAEQFAKKGELMEAEGAKWDFSEFNKVVDGKKGPLFEVMKKMKEAAGERDLFILTARSPEAAKAIQKFLKEMGIDIPLENIKGLADSSPTAKADYILDLAVKGYNDFYFADDARSNVKAVRDLLEQIDVKSKVQQAIASKSKDLDKDFNKILEDKSGIEWYKEYSKAKAEVVGARKGRYKILLPPGAEDFTGLIYSTLSKGKVGEAQLEWYNDNLIKPYNRAARSLASDRVNMMADFKALKKQLNVPKELNKSNETGFTNEQAARVYIWQSQGVEVPGLSKRDLRELNEVIENNPTLKAFADQLQTITKGDLYTSPSKDWLSGTITTDLIELINTTKRNSYLEGWKQNIDVIYSEKNLNKLEAIYGRKYREALENSLTRMRTGRNRTSTGNKAGDKLLDYINGAQGTIMFFNMRSAILQSISAANFINLGFNNPIKAGRAFVNQKQYWKDFMSIMNSDYLINRRNGLKLNISESEIADAAKSSTNKAKAVINYILEKGYAPTKFMDSFAIASGGATWYRNKIKDLVKKEGLSEAEAQKKAFEEFMEISEKSQQSSDPSKISAQQSSDMGRVFLQFVNTPMQYARLQKRALQDLGNKRGDWKSNVSKILYYGVVQNLWFNAMQQGLFALGFGDEEINEKEEKKIIDTANGMADSILRGTGFAGMTISVLKNTIIDLYRRSGRQRPEYGDAWVKLLEFSPAVKSKFGKLKSAAYPFDTKEGRKEIKEKGFSLDNPAYESAAKVISATTNIPLDRLFLKYDNLSAMMSEDTETWKDIALFLGWPEWQLAEGGTVEEDKIRNMKNETKKEEQVQMLLDLGYSKGEIRRLKKEEDRVKAIINSKSGKKVKRKRVIY